MAIPRIPNQIVLQIVKHQTIDSVLCAFSLTCRALRDPAQQILFHTPIPRTAYHHLLFMDAILSSPDRLALMVNSFVHISGSAFCDGTDAALVKKLGEMLRMMANLKRLAFRNAKNLPSSVLQGTTFQLEAFDWGPRHRTGVLRVLREFLPTQPGLQHLTVYSYGLNSGQQDVVAALCPQLRSLTGGSAAVKAFLPGRQVTHLQWVPEDQHEIRSAVPGIDLGQLRFLRCIVYDGRLPSFARGLTSLVLLEAIGNCRAGTFADYMELETELARIPTLQVLILVDYVPEGWMAANPLYPWLIAYDIFSWCSCLENIDIGLPATGVEQQFRRFKRSDVNSSIKTAGQTVQSSTVFAWRSLSVFGEVETKPQPILRSQEAVLMY